MRSRSIRIAAGGALLAGLMLPATAGTAAGRTALSGNRPAWTAGLTATRQVAAAQQVEGAVYLNLRNAAGAAQLAAAVSDPANLSYRHYLSAAQWNSLFAPSQASVDRVAAFLRSQGLQVTDVPSNRLYVGFHGTAAQANAAFGTTLSLYSHAGGLHMAPSVDPSVPGDLAADVSGVAGLDDSTMRPTYVTDGAAGPDNYGPPAGFRNAPPCSTYWGEDQATQAPPAYGRTQPDVICGYTPQQLRGAYGTTSLINAGTDGHGQTVAIVDAFASHTLVSDVSHWSANMGVPAFKPGQLTLRLADDIYRASPNAQCGPTGWSGEQALDIEAVHGLAPGANIVYEGAKSCYDHALLARLNDVVANQRAQLISNSWGNNGEQTSPGLVRAYESIFKQAAAEGIGIFFSSGDYGDEQLVTGKVQPDFPAVDPWVTSVGGTSLGVTSSNGYGFEVGWGTLATTLDPSTHKWSPAPPGSFLYGAGGGTSHMFEQPWYQRGVVPASLSHRWGADAMRVVPDIAAVADVQTGFEIGLTQAFPGGNAYGQYRIGGTSLACPAMAAMEALADEVAGAPHGFANPAIYRLYGNSSALHDVSSTDPHVAVVRTNYANGLNASSGYVVSLRTTNHDTSLSVGPGYDDVTGVGTPIFPGYAASLGR